MFNILKTLLLFLLLLFFTACIGAKVSPIKANEKAFDEEDTYILFALRAEELQSFEGASKIFSTLYKKSQKKEYLYRSLKNDLAAIKDEKVISRVDAIIGDAIDDFVLIRLKIIALITLNRLEEAKDLSIKLVNISNNVDDYLLVSEIYVKLKKFNTAVKYLESAYVKNYSEKILNKMSIVLYVNLNRKKDAIAQLETHTRVHGCSVLICKRLAGFYSNDNDINGLLSAYLRLYNIDAKKGIAQKIVQIYGYNKDYIKMMNFLETSKSNDELLLQVYINLKNYIKASPLAYQLYKKTGETIYLGQSAIFEYESSEDQKNKKMQNSVIKKLKDVINKSREGLYLNYLGYLLIDHEIDVKKGMRYIDEALLLEPKSLYYLDSLAWGYYKLGNCKKAKAIMSEIKKLGGSDNDEVKSHINIIKKCKIIKKANNKK